MKVISDLHISLPDVKNNDFELDEDVFIAYLQNSVAEVDLLVLNGDIFECWETGLESQSGRFQSIARARPRLVRCIMDGMRAGRIIYNNGNHDAICRTNRELWNGLVRENTTILVHGRRIHVAHGHQADIYNVEELAAEAGCCQACFGTCCTLGRCITWCVGTGEVLIDKDLDIHLEKLKLIVETPSTDTIFTSHARRLAAQNRFDVVVYGHTHKAKIVPLVEGKPGPVYANDGCGQQSSDVIDEAFISVQPTGECVVQVRKYSTVRLAVDSVTETRVIPGTRPSRAPQTSHTRELL